MSVAGLAEQARQVMHEGVREHVPAVVFAMLSGGDDSLTATHLAARQPYFWLQPILTWTKRDCLDYLESVGLERNPVSVNCHRSGECLCGALANHAELGEISFFYPHVGERFARLRAEVVARGIPNADWGQVTLRRRVTARSRSVQPLCASCEVQLGLWNDETP